MSEILNANPTIRSIADLPSRRREPSKKSRNQRPFGLLSSIIPDSAHHPDPFNPSSVSESESTDSDEEVEPIDEQEIYERSSVQDIELDGPRIWFLRNLELPSVHTLNSRIDMQVILKNVKANLTPFLHHTDLIAPIQDPEHPLTLGSLSVVNLPDISLTPTLPPSSLCQTPSSSFSATQLPAITTVTVLVTPTITHCSLATVIGLGVRVRLEQALPPRFRVDVRIKEGTHSTAEQVNRQLGDKERVAAALENGTLMGVLRKMLEGC
ncbi:MAG: hypothetical protein Q9179_001956 [Wetmoreana sp. 5 TL-2023]